MIIFRLSCSCSWTKWVHFIVNSTLHYISITFMFLPFCFGRCESQHKITLNKFIKRITHDVPVAFWTDILQCIKYRVAFHEFCIYLLPEEYCDHQMFSAGRSFFGRNLAHQHTWMWIDSKDYWTIHLGCKSTALYTQSPKQGYQWLQKISSREQNNSFLSIHENVAFIWRYRFFTSYSLQAEINSSQQDSPRGPAKGCLWQAKPNSTCEQKTTKWNLSLTVA